LDKVALASLAPALVRGGQTNGRLRPWQAAEEEPPARGARGRRSAPAPARRGRRGAADDEPKPKGGLLQALGLGQRTIYNQDD